MGIALILPLPLYAQTHELSEAPDACRTMRVDANRADCDEAHCVLTGNAHLECDDFELWANTIDIEFDGERRFTRAIAEGDVAAIDGDTVLTCNKVVLEGDRIRGRIEGATVEMKEHGGSLENLIASRNRAMLQGEVERTGARTFEVDDAVLTLCDCGDNKRPSWSMRAASIDANLDRRADLYWSVLWIAPFGVDVPLLPPIPYISIPFEQRATGFLPPMIALFDGLKPQIDLPFFVPIGDAYDLTITPGLRTDWVSDKGNALDKIGAPRLGLRLRYAPVEGTNGEVKLQYQRDIGASARDETLDETQDSPCDSRPAPEACDFHNRFAINLIHQSRLTSKTDFVASGQWISDDLFLNDVSIDLNDRVRQYLTSRAQLDYRTPWFYGAAAADYTLRTQGQTTQSNTEGGETGTLHRGPHFELRMPSVALGSGLHVGAGATATRYGSWFRRFFSSESPEQPEQWVYRTYSTLSLYDGWGPFAFRAGATLDGIVSDVNSLDRNPSEPHGEPFDTRPRQALSLFSTAAAELPLRGQFGPWTHTMTPRLALQAIPWTSKRITAAAGLDPYLEREVFAQGLAGLDQELHFKGVRRLRLLVEQPIDLKTRERLQLRGRMTVTPARWTSLSFRTQYAPRAEDPFREVGATLRAGYRGLQGQLNYQRFFPDSERFTRTVYQLAGVPAFTPIDPENPGSEQSLGAGASFSNETLTFSYGANRLFRRPGGNNNSNSIPGSGDGRPYWTNQTAGIQYRSPCKCWGVGLNMVLQRIPNEDRWQRRFNFMFQIGDYSLGSAS